MNNNIPHQLPTYINPSIDLLKVREECQQLVKTRARVSAGVAVVPIPFLDMVVDAGMLVNLLPEITARFCLIDDPNDLNIFISQDQRSQAIKKRIFELVGIAGTGGFIINSIQGFAKRVVTKQVGKYVPFGGQMVVASIGYVVFKRVAYEHIEECYNIALKIQNQSAIKDVAVA